MAIPESRNVRASSRKPRLSAKVPAHLRQPSVSQLAGSNAGLTIDAPASIVIIPAARQTCPAAWSDAPMPDWPSDYAWRNCGKDETGQRQYNYRRPDEVLAVIASTVVVGDDGRWHNG